MLVGVDLSVDPTTKKTYLAMASSYEKTQSKYHFGVKQLTARPDMRETSVAIRDLLVLAIEFAGFVS